MRAHVPTAWPDELVVDVMELMARCSVTVIPVLDRLTGEFIGTLDSHNVVDIVSLMEEVKRERQLMGAA